MIHCKGCNKPIKYNSWTYHLRTYHPENPDGASVDDANVVDGDATAGPRERPPKIAKRRQSEPQPICNINVKQVSSKSKKAKSASVAKET